MQAREKVQASTLKMYFLKKSTEPLRAQSAGPTFSQHFPTQVSPHYIQLDPIYYGQLLYLVSLHDMNQIIYKKII